MRTSPLSIYAAFFTLIFSSAPLQAKNTMSSDIDISSPAANLEFKTAYNMPKPNKDEAQVIISEDVDIKTFSALIDKHAGNDNVQIIDVRTLGEFNDGHIANAQLIDFYAKDFIQKIKQLDKEKTYLLYCRSDNRSGKTLQLMKRLGFKSAYNMQGGMKAWNSAKYPTVKAK